MPEAAPAVDAMASDGGVTGYSGSSKSSYTKTNVQVAEVDEGDIVKTDGRAIYVASGKQVVVLLPDGAKTKEIARLDVAQVAKADGLDDEVAFTGPIQDMMLSGTVLAVLAHEYDAKDADFVGGSSDVAVQIQASRTKVFLFDLADPARPQYRATFGQSGTYTTSRLYQGVLYLVSQYQVADPEKIVKDDPSTFVPSLDSKDGRIWCPVGEIGIAKVPNVSDPTYTVVTALDLDRGERLGEHSVLGAAGTVYMSTENLYIAGQNASETKPSASKRRAGGVAGTVEEPMTRIIRIALNDGAVKLAAQAAVPGRLVNQFALDEYEGHLRAVTTVWDEKGEHASLYVLKDDMKLASSIPKLVTDESVKSVRFDGATAYVVTYQQVDPLFAIDLSRPSKPKVMSALKIPGFSSYLHPWDEGLLLGVGYDGTDEGAITGMKLAMFDTSDPFDVTEKAKLHLSGDQSEVLDDHRAILVDAERALIGFPVFKWGKDYEGAELGYNVYSYSADKGFKDEKEIVVKEFSQGEDSYQYTSTVRLRSLIVGDYLYLRDGDSVSVYTTDSFAQELKLSVK
jgi:uncharacterized secreted protein with C-terminal beta-propeller domain